MHSHSRRLKVDQSDVVERLDKLIALFRLVNATALSAAKDAALSDPVVKLLLKECPDWRKAGELKSKVATIASTSEKTVQRRMQELVDEGVLIVRKDGQNLLYKDAGLLS
jgi:hypothetical protein